MLKELYECSGKLVVGSAIRKLTDREFVWWTTHGEARYHEFLHRGYTHLQAYRAAILEDYTDVQGPDNARYKLLNLKQGAKATVSAYKSYYDGIFSQLPKADQRNSDMLLACFRKGLRPDLRYLMGSVQVYSDVVECFQAALKAEKTLGEIEGTAQLQWKQQQQWRAQREGKQQLKPPRTSYAAAVADGPVPMDIGAVLAAAQTALAGGNSSAAPAIVESLLADLSKLHTGGAGPREGAQASRGACYTCGKQGHWAAKCPDRKKGKGKGKFPPKDFRGNP